MSKTGSIFNQIKHEVMRIKELLKEGATVNVTVSLQDLLEFVHHVTNSPDRHPAPAAEDSVREY